ncbi:MAG: DinB family protein [Bacteroidota bacterium]
MRYSIWSILLLFPLIMVAQTPSSEAILPYHQIPDAPESFSATNVVSRMVDGLGYRFYWATEGLRPEDLAYKPTPESRSMEETIDHVIGLSEGVLNAAQKQDNVRPVDRPEMDFAAKRKYILETLKAASDAFRAADSQKLEEHEVAFSRDGNRTAYPFWNLLNGQLADALWHTGQIVMMRRSAGNPINPKVSVFTGKTRE